ncbi:MAG: right-handed parallel beta-helix repeat-containing protein [Gemmatimonadota bacterium]
MRSPNRMLALIALAASAAALVLTAGCAPPDSISAPAIQLAPTAPSLDAVPPLGPIVLDSVYRKATEKIYLTFGADSVMKVMAQKDSLNAIAVAAEAAGDQAASAAARLALRTFQIAVSLGALGTPIADATVVAVDAALADAQNRITYWKSKGTNVTLPTSLAATATSQLAQAKLAANAASKLDLATKAGANIMVIRNLLQPVPGAATPPPPPPPSGLWATIEAPRAWDYVPTPVDQAACGATGKTYDVGPGKTYATPAGVPWQSLLPCDNVRIFYQATPYRDVIFLSNRGAAHKYIRIVGMPGPNGELPILDGNGATIKAGTPFINQVFDGLGMIVVSPPVGYTYGYKPGYLEIANLEIRNSSKIYNHTKLSGQSVAWDDFASGIYIERAENVAIRNCHIHDNGIGIFQNSKYDEAGQSRYLLVEGNSVHDNGVVGDAHEHNAYTEGIGTVYQFNHFGQIASGSYGDNIKDRSAGITFRYNWIAGGVYEIALQDPQSNANWERQAKDAWGNLLVNAAYIYGNVLVMRDRPDFPISWTKSLVAFGDGPYSYGNVRGGTVYFYQNTVISQFDWTPWQYSSAVLFSVLNSGTHPVVQARNNAFWATSLTPGKKATPFALFYNYGYADFSANWMSAGWLPIEPGNHSGNSVLNVGPAFDGTGVSSMFSNAANTPGFVNAGQNDFHLLGSSVLIGQGTALDAEVIKTGNAPLFEYIGANQWKLRKVVAVPALGAFEP